jgi:MFS family permease
MGLIGAGHFMSHFYGLTLPPMFPIFKAEFGVSYAALGLLMAAYSLIGGLLQAPVGYLVDRIGPGRVLIIGMALIAVAIGAIGLVDSYPALFVLAVLAGIGNSVFHPADYAVLARIISQRALGRAYSIHTFTGFFGGSVAPMTMIAIAAGTAWGWRGAFFAAGAVGIAVALAMIAKARLLDAKSVEDVVEAASTAAPRRTPGGLAFLTLPVLFFFLFFVAFGMTTGGLFSFTVTALTQVQSVDLAAASTAFSGFLFAMAFGVLVGGVIADRVDRHGLVTAIAMTGGAAVLMVVASVQLPIAVLVLAMGFVGLALGVVLPARDMLLRAMTPTEQTGKVVGFVFVGLSLGSAVSPYMFGWLLDRDEASLVFILCGVFMVGGMLATMAAQAAAPAPRSKLSLPR